MHDERLRREVAERVGGGEREGERPRYCGRTKQHRRLSVEAHARRQRSRRQRERERARPAAGVNDGGEEAALADATEVARSREANLRGSSLLEADALSAGVSVILRDRRYDGARRKRVVILRTVRAGQDAGLLGAVVGGAAGVAVALDGLAERVEDAELRLLKGAEVGGVLGDGGLADAEATGLRPEVPKGRVGGEVDVGYEDWMVAVVNAVVLDRKI